MVGKDEELGDMDDEGLARVRQIADRKRRLEETAETVQEQIRSCFERLSQALRGREKQLLRQVEAVHRQQLSLVQSDPDHLVPVVSESGSGIEADLTGERELLERLAGFGRIDLSNALAVNDSVPYKAEEYLEAGEDVVSFDKSLKTEADEFDVSSVIRRKRGLDAIAMNLNCTSCSDTCRYESVASGSKTKKVDDSPVSPESTSSSGTSYSFEKIQVKEVEEDASLSEDDDFRSANEITAQMEKFHFEDENSNDCQAVTENENNDDTSKSADDCATIKIQDQAKDGNVEHPVQIQQWLQQILAETETEPIIHEIGQIISKIPNPRLYREFPVET